MKPIFNTFSKIKKKLHFFGLFIPLKRNGLILVVVILTALFYIKSYYFTEESNIKPYFELFGWIFLSFATLVVGAGLVYTLTCWVYLLIKINKLKPEIKIGLEGDIKGTAGKVPISIILPDALMPLFGYLKVRIIYQNKNISSAIVINRFAKGWRDLRYKEGKNILWLPDSKLYQIRGFVITCEDYLQLFSFSLFKKSKKNFYLSPPEVLRKVDDIVPSQTKEMVQKIKTSKRVSGDFFNYKDFESGDDVRRIVWKIFAKNKELVVRVPEVINPYASHIYFYACFYNSLSYDFDASYSKSMLNFYKDSIFSICKSLEKDNRKVEFAIDQPFNNLISIEKKDKLAYMISYANWQREMTIGDLPIQKKEIILCVSSLTPAEELEELVNNHAINLYVINVSQYLDSKQLFKWKNAILRNNSNGEKNKIYWLFSSLRRRLKQNEKKLKALAEQDNFQGHII